MNPNTIRAIDYWIGKPICFLLSLINFSSPRTGKPKKIVFLKFIEQGATVLAYSALKRATELVGKENVYFCVFENNRPILDVLEIIPPENIISIREKTFLSFISSAFSALLKIRKQKIDTVIDMEFFSRASAIFSFLSGAKTRIGLHRFTSELPYRGNLMTHRIQYNPYLHIAAFYHSLVEASLQDPSEIPMMKIPRTNFVPVLPVFSPDKNEREAVQEKIAAAFGTGAKKIVILNPNASDLLPLRKWDKQNFIELGKKIIAEDAHACIAISGAPSEQKDAEDICARIGSSKAVSFAGKTSLRELLALYSLSDILITNDSGPGHFSALTDIKTIILFGPETPKLFGPISPNARVIWKELACSPCVNVLNHRFSPCNNNVCMKSITVEEVYEAVKNLLIK
ncbi:MAG: glycosyltransferase family 9 protein [Bacteroidia bacterium]